MPFAGTSPKTHGNRPRKSAAILFLSALGMVHACLVVDQIFKNSPVWHEPASVLAAHRQVREWDFSTYRVNGALSRWFSGAMSASVELPNPPARPTLGITRSEFADGAAFAKQLGAKFVPFVRLARLTNLPFSLVGMFVCFVFAEELHGRAAGFATASLWALSPTILGLASVAVPDLIGAVLGLSAIHAIHRFSFSPNPRLAFLSGLLAGLAAATKSTYLVLAPLFLLFCFLAPAIFEQGDRRVRRVVTDALRILLTMLFAINAVYLFDGSGRRLRDYRFVSRSLGGVCSLDSLERNRFSDTIVGFVPVALPMHFVLGIDEQLRDFEIGMPTYFRGEWRDAGPPHYYYFAFGVKETLVVLVLLVFRLGLSVFSRRATVLKSEFIPVTTALVLLALVSSQTGVNRHYRYILLVVPLAYLWASGVFSLLKSEFARQSALVVILVASAIALARVHSCELSFFNGLAGGPEKGHESLLGSHLDWGQDLSRLKRWLEIHPSARPIRIHVDVSYDPKLIIPPSEGVIFESDPDDAISSSRHSDTWFAISTNRLLAPASGFEELRRQVPLAHVGYSIRIYRRLGMHERTGADTSLRRRSKP